MEDDFVPQTVSSVPPLTDIDTTLPVDLAKLMTLTIPPSFGDTSSVLASKDKPKDPYDLAISRATALSNPLDQVRYSTTGQVADRYNDPNLQYNPMYNMEELYAQTHPFTVGDSIGKFWETLKVHTFSSFKNFASGLNDLAAGKEAAFWDNENADQMKIAMENIETMFPQYKTQDQTDNPFAFRNLGQTTLGVLPAFGTAVGGIVDMLAGHAILSAAGTLTSGPVGGIAANLAGIMRDTKILKNVFKALGNTTKQLATVNRLGQIKTKAQLVTSSLFYANGEAAIQAKMNASKYIEDETKKYFEATGRMPGEAQMKEFEATAQQIGDTTFKMNLALIGGSQIIQVPGLLMGKVNKNIVDQLPIKFVNGKAVGGSLKKALLWETLKDSTVEGLEEYGQSVIDDATTKFYTNRDKSLFAQTMDSAFNRLNTEGAMDFYGGFLVGTGMNIGTNAFQYRNTKRNMENVVNAYNTSTENLFNSYKQTTYNHARLKKALEDDSDIAFMDVMGDEIANLAEVDAANLTTDARKDHFTTLKGMDTNEFNAYTGMSLTEPEQAKYVSELEQEYNNALIIYEGIDNVFRVNPFATEPSFKKLIKDTIGKVTPFNIKNEDQYSAVVWNDLKRITARNLIKQSQISEEVAFRQTLFKADTVFSNMQTEEEIDLLLNPNIEEAVKTWRSRTKNYINADPTLNNRAFETIHNNIENLSIIEQFAAILDFYGINSTKEGNNVRSKAELFDAILRLKAAEKVFIDTNNELRTPYGQKEEIKRIVSYMEYMARSVESKNNPVPEVRIETPETVADLNNPNEDITLPDNIDELFVDDEINDDLRDTEEALKDFDDVRNDEGLEVDPALEEAIYKGEIDFDDVRNEIEPVEDQPNVEEEVVNKREIDFGGKKSEPKTFTATSGKVFKLGDFYFKSYKETGNIIETRALYPDGIIRDLKADNKVQPIEVSAADLSIAEQELLGVNQQEQKKSKEKKSTLEQYVEQNPGVDKTLLENLILNKQIKIIC
jgi:antitoxin component of MazEF toxin-antitoxin module